MSAELATRGPIGMDVEKVLIGGDLAQLTPDQRLNYYNTLCQSLGLSPLTQPFQYIVLNGKLQLYAKKDCTEQLRKIHGVSINSVDPKQIGDLFVVVASAADREGRVDSATGAVNMKGLGGENLANAMMKCETKAKRRVTLSICGLGMLDETEVQTLREQGVATEPAGNKWEAPNPSSASTTARTVDAQERASTQSSGAGSTTQSSAISHDNSEPQITPRSRKGAQPSTQSPPTQPAASQGPAIKAGEVFPPEQRQQFEPPISKPQSNRYFAIMKSASVTDEQSARQLASLGWNGSRDEMPKRIYNQAIDLLDPQFKFHTAK